MDTFRRLDTAKTIISELKGHNPWKTDTTES